MPNVAPRCYVPVRVCSTRPGYIIYLGSCSSLYLGTLGVTVGIRHLREPLCIGQFTRPQVLSGPKGFEVSVEAVFGRRLSPTAFTMRGAKSDRDAGLALLRSRGELGWRPTSGGDDGANYDLPYWSVLQANGES